MFPTPAAPLTSLTKTRPFGIGRRRSRVSGQPEVKGMIPSSTMAEEILTPGEGQVRAMILVMTNPLRSAANSAQLEAAFSQLDFLVAIDIYINETTRHAHLILPTPTPAEQSNYEFGLYHLSVRNMAKWSSPAVSPPAGVPEAWQVLLKLSAPFLGMGDGSIKDIDDTVFGQLVTEAVKNNGSWADLTEE